MILRKLRNERGYTSKFVYTVLGVNQSTFSHYERADKRPNINFFLELQKLYQLNDSEILKVMQIHEQEVTEKNERKTKRTT